MESDIPGIDVYDKNKNKLKDKYAKVVSSLPDDGICDKNGKKLNGIFKKLKPIEKDEKGKELEKPLPGKLRDRFGDTGKGGDGKEKYIPGKLKNPFDNMNKGGKGDDKLYQVN